MSADLFAVFGTPDKAPSREQLDERWSIPQETPALTAKPQLRQAEPSNGEILFDADEADVEDDFGDFEDVETQSLQDQSGTTEVKRDSISPPIPIVSNQFNLLDLGDEPAHEVEMQHRRFPSKEVTNGVAASSDTDEWGDFEELAQEPEQQPKQTVERSAPHVLTLSTLSKPAQHLSDGKNEAWDDFEDWNAEAGEASANNSSLPRPEIPDEPRPVNIPPPTILLQLLLLVFQSLRELAKDAQEATEIDETAASIVTVFAVSARIIAGRSLRWRRDNYLAQSTKIGPSVSGARSGGMKLTALNKSEAIREEREAADVCDAWSRNTHIFASIVTRSEHTRPWMNLNIRMMPRPSPGFGTLEAKEPCALCGIKRDERIAGVDFDADDVFNEYWTEYWGHTDCKVFWYTYRDMLNQR